MLTGHPTCGRFRFHRSRRDVLDRFLYSDKRWWFHRSSSIYNRIEKRLVFREQRVVVGSKGYFDERHTQYLQRPGCVDGSKWKRQVHPAEGGA